MARIVDGDNLLGSWPGRDRSDAEKRNLAGEIGRMAAADRRRVVLVFDGESPTPPPGGAETRFAGRGRTADDLILAFLRAEPERAGWTVVTSDRSLADRCRSLGATVERCDVFRKRIEARPEREKPEHTDVSFWLEVFGGSGPDEPPPAPPASRSRRR